LSCLDSAILSLALSLIPDRAEPVRGGNYPAFYTGSDMAFLIARRF
jgi:hypothetical protein